MNITELPFEVLLVCFDYVRGTDLIKLAKTCQTFKSVIQTESVWKKACQREFRLDPATQLKCSFRYFYCKVLIKYGCMIGLWINSTTCYGGLVHIWFTDDGTILAEEHIPPARVREKMFKKPLFHVKTCENGQIDVRWLLDIKGLHSMDIKPTIGKKGARRPLSSAFSVVLKRTVGEEQKKENLEEEKTEFFKECRLQGTDGALCSYKWDMNVRYYGIRKFERIEKWKCLPVADAPIQPGFFKGMYGGHGTELVHLYYIDSTGYVKKISGDPNVPSGETSVRFYTEKHMTLTRDHQTSIQDLEAISDDPSDDTYSPYDPKKPTSQPFVCSRGANMHSDDDDSTTPDRCIARFHGLGTVSPMGYTNPTNIVTHFIVFNENMFGVIWLDLYSFSVFSRVEETFPAL